MQGGRNFRGGKGSSERSTYRGGNRRLTVGDRELEMEDVDWVSFDLMLSSSNCFNF